MCPGEQVYRSVFTYLSHYSGPQAALLHTLFGAQSEVVLADLTTCGFRAHGKESEARIIDGRLRWSRGRIFSSTVHTQFENRANRGSTETEQLGFGDRYYSNCVPGASVNTVKSKNSLS